jgi:hypothetical protein
VAECCLAVDVGACDVAVADDVVGVAVVAARVVEEMRRWRRREKIQKKAETRTMTWRRRRERQERRRKAWPGRRGRS